ncbi:hypothetical protein GSH05_18865 [Burkholderia pseudomallei]|nr:hypothetical protein [Burkholderia pseudomallei]PJO61288.1 hypothetical protein CWD85_02000 [Burkholderia pseudomallei]
MAAARRERARASRQRYRPRLSRERYGRDAGGGPRAPRPSRRACANDGRRARAGKRRRSDIGNPMSINGPVKNFARDSSHC